MICSSCASWRSSGPCAGCSSCWSRPRCGSSATARTRCAYFFDENLDVFRPVFKHFHYDLDHSPVVGTIQKSFGYKHSTLALVAALLLAYALIELVEAGGLWYAKRWAEYLTVVATAAFLPLEIYELTEHVSYLKIATLVLNILAVLYIALAKRLFGLRGGRKAFEEERHSASLLEVEESAGVAAHA